MQMWIAESLESGVKCVKISIFLSTGNNTNLSVDIADLICQTVYCYIPHHLRQGGF